MGKTLVLRYAAFGDWIYVLPTLRKLFEEGEEVYLHTGYKGHQILRNEDRLTELSIFEPFGLPKEQQKAAVEQVWSDLVTRIRPDTILHLSNTIEGAGLADCSNLEHWNMSLKKRRRLLGTTPFVIMPLGIYLGSEADAFRIIEDRGYAPISYTQDEIEWAERWRESNLGKFVVLMTLHGTTHHKQFPQCQDWAETILKKYPSAIVYLAGDGAGKNRPFGFDGRVANTIGAPFRQLSLMARYSDLVIGPPTGLLTCAVMWGTPRIILATDASVRQLAYGSKNDFSVQSTTSCSPCNRAIYKPEDCLPYSTVRDGLAECSYNFDKDEIMSKVDFVYSNVPWRLTKQFRTAHHVSWGPPPTVAIKMTPENIMEAEKSYERTREATA